MKKRVLSALLALCLTLSLAGAAFAENETLSPAQETSVSESASSAAEPQEEKESEVEAEEISTAETAQEPSYPAQDFEAAVDGADMAVNVSAPEGALPEDVTLTASLVGSSEDNADDQAVADVAAELDDADVEYDGFVALDISFVDADGNKVEPLQPVSVNFTLPAELLPEDVDPSTLEVQHLKEDVETEEVVAVETVADTADATEGTVTVDTPVATLSADSDTALPADAQVTAEFAVDGFSIFTITWQGEGDLGGLAEFNLDTICVDDINGVEIGKVDFKKVYTYHSSLSFGSNDLNVNEIAPVFKGYDFLYAEITDDSGKIHHVDAVGIEKKLIPFNPQIQAYYNDGWHDVGNKQIRFVYHKDETSSGGSGAPSTLTHEKYVTANNNGTYDLNLDVIGSVGSEERKAQVDVVYVLDMSSSMNYGLNGDAGTAFSKKRIRLASEAIRTMSESLTLNDKIDARFALAKFGTLSMSSMDWTDEPTVLLNSLPIDVQSGQGTNYEAGLNSAISLLESARDDAIKIVVFISDGDPTHYGNGSRDDSGNIPIAKAKAVVSEMTDIDHFYAVGVGPSAEYARLGELIGAVAERVETKPVFEGKDEASLSKAFEDIESSITYIPCTDVTITDVLSDNVEVEKDNNGVPKLDITVLNDNGDEVSSDPQVVNGQIQVTFTAPVVQENGSTQNTEFTLTARTETNAQNKTQIVLDFPDEYQLNQDWSYKVTATVGATQAAYDAYAENNYQYPNEGESGTGITSEGQDGVFSNESATLSYTVNGKEKTEDYAMPVIQLHPNTLTIEKEFKGLTTDQINVLTGLTFDVELTNSAFTNDDGITGENGKRTQTVTFTTTGDNAFTKKEGTDYIYTYSIRGISPGTSYTVTEESEDSEEYTCELENSSNLEGTFDKDETKTARFTNTYREKPKYADLTIDKNLSNNVTGNVTQTFTFTVEKTDGDITDGTKYGDVEFNENKATVTITGDSAKTLVGLPLGQYKITEIDPAEDIDLDQSDEKRDYYLTGTTHQVGSANTEDGKEVSINLQEATTVTFTNNYKPYKTLTVKKVVTGEMGSSSDYFDFSAKIGDTPVALINQSDDEKARTEGYDFKLNSNGDVTLVNLKENDTVIISEATNDNRGYTAKEPTVTSTVLKKGTSPEGNYTVSGNTSFTITVPGGDTTDLGIITFNNERNAVAPTGLEDNHTKPFGLMVGVAVMAGLALAGGAVVRRRRRWME